MRQAAEIFRKMEDDLTWRGPGGRELRYIVLEREEVFTLIKWVKHSVRPECVAELVGDGR